MNKREKELLVNLYGHLLDCNDCAGQRKVISSTLDGENFSLKVRAFGFVAGDRLMSARVESGRGDVRDFKQVVKTNFGRTSKKLDRLLAHYGTAAEVICSAMLGLSTRQSIRYHELLGHLDAFKCVGIDWGDLTWLAANALGYKSWPDLMETCTDGEVRHADMTLTMRRNQTVAESAAFSWRQPDSASSKLYAWHSQSEAERKKWVLDRYKRSSLYDIAVLMQTEFMISYYAAVELLRELDPQMTWAGWNQVNAVYGPRD